MRVALAAMLLCAGPAWADRIDLPDAVDRKGTVDGTYMVDPPRDGGGTLALEWTDSLGRVVQRQAIPAEGNAIPFRIDAGRAVALRNTLRASLDRDGATSTAERGFAARPPAGWSQFRVIMYADQDKPALAGLHALGISGVRVFGHRVPFTPADVEARVAPAAGANLRWYVENIATDFYAPYHMWTPEHPQQVTWRFLEAQARHRRDPADLSVYERVPSLSDAAWIGRIRARLAEHVRIHGAYRPFYYSLGDEPGIADLAAAWDFDRSPPALAAFRAWLREGYGTLDALNAAWGTTYAGWDAVMPEGTTAAMARGDGNFAAWNDHKSFMDASFGAALRAGTEAVHAADPDALAGIEGGQIPGWGGWDYGQVAPAVDVMEIYEAGQNVEIARAINPGLITLNTVFSTGPEARRQIWRAAMQGAAGLILWDEDNAVIRPDGTPGPRGLAEGPLFRRLAGGLGALLLAAPQLSSEVAVLYSPASFRLRWLLDHRPRGDAWTERSSELENEENAVRAAMRTVSGALAGLGIMPGWITHEQLTPELLRARKTKLLVLPGVMALSDAEAAVIAAFAAAGGVVMAEGETGTFDGQARRRAAPALPAGLARPLSRDAVMAALATPGPPPYLALPASLTADGPPTVTVRRDGGAVLVGIVAARPGRAEHEIPAPGWVMRDLLAGDAWREVGARARIRLDEDGVGLVAFLLKPPPAPQVAADATARAGETAWAHVRLPTGNAVFLKVLGIEVRDPTGREVPAYSGTVTTPADGGQPWPIPFALNDPPGDWTITARDPLGGGAATRVVRLLPAVP